MKKGNERQIAKLKFKILDVRVVKNGSEIYMELTNAKERGNVVKLKLSPPPKKNMLTLFPHFQIGAKKGAI